MREMFCGGALLLALIGYGCSSSNLGVSTTDSSFSQEERLYLNAMAEHEKLGLNLAQDAQRQAKDKGVKQLADRLVGDYNTRLRKLEGLGAVVPDGRQNPEQEKRAPAAGQPGGPSVAGLEVGPGMVTLGQGSYDARWLKTFRRHNENGLRLGDNLGAHLKNQGLLRWNQEMVTQEKAELAEFQALRVL